MESCTQHPAIITEYCETHTKICCTEYGVRSTYSVQGNTSAMVGGGYPANRTIPGFPFVSPLSGQPVALQGSWVPCGQVPKTFCLQTSRRQIVVKGLFHIASSPCWFAEGGHGREGRMGYCVYVRHSSYVQYLRGLVAKPQIQATTVKRLPRVHERT
jgi:hypothetical protein